ncbi:MAG: hypothetical protein AAF363_04615 [Bacteroidota bacterium]
MKSYLSNPILIIVGLFLVIELIATMFSPFRNYPNASNALRNPKMKEGWPEYLEGRGKVDDKSAVIITNSQGYGVEFKNPDSIYFSFLKERLKQNSPGLEVENWALTGLRTADIELMTIKAQLRNVDYIFLILHWDNFDYKNEINLTYPNTDVNLLIGDIKSWDLLEHTLVQESFDNEDVIERFVRLRINTLRLRTPFYRKISKYFSIEDQIFYLGQPFRLERGADVRDENFRSDLKKRIERKKYKGQKDRDVNIKQVTERLATFYDFNMLLSKRLKETGTKLVYIWAPIAWERVPERNVNSSKIFYDSASLFLSKLDISNIDLTNKVNSRYFLTKGHFTKEGHQYFSDILTPIIQGELQ